NQEIQCKGNVFMFMSCPEGLWFSDLKEDSFGILNYNTQNATWILKTNINKRSKTAMDEYKERLKTTLLRRLQYAYYTLKSRNLNDYNFGANGIYGVYV